MTTTEEVLARIVVRLTAAYKQTSESTNVKVLTIDAEQLAIIETELRKVLQSELIGTATGTHLDLFGDYFDLPRKTGESDDDYRSRLLALAAKGLFGVTVAGLKDGLATFGDINPEDVAIFEQEPLFPAENLFPATDLYPPAYYIAHFKVIIDLERARHVHWEETKEIIDRLKAAGVSFELQLFDMISESYPALLEIVIHKVQTTIEENVALVDEAEVDDYLTGWHYEEIVTYTKT